MSLGGSLYSQERETHEDRCNIHKFHLQWDVAGASITRGWSHRSRVNCVSLRVMLLSGCRWIRLGGQNEVQVAL